MLLGQGEIADREVKSTSPCVIRHSRVAYWSKKTEVLM